MGMSAQQKMLHVADRLGLTTLKDMQGTTRMVYDSQGTAAFTHTFFKGASQRAFPLTNVGANGNQFQVDEALLVEGYTDVISLHQAGLNNVVASSGTSLTVDQIRLLRRYTENIVLLYDGDETLPLGDNIWAAPLSTLWGK
jgi:hypothetical protein